MTRGRLPVGVAVGAAFAGALVVSAVGILARLPVSMVGVGLSVSASSLFYIAISAVRRVIVYGPKAERSSPPSLSQMLMALATGRHRADVRSRAEPGTRMRLMARLMPGAAGQEWVAEARSVLFDAAPEMRRVIARSYLLTAPQVLAGAWARALAGRLRAAQGAPGPGGRQ
jgi:hypothetical protein